MPRLYCACHEPGFLRTVSVQSVRSLSKACARCQVSPERTAMSTPAATGADQRPARRHGSLVAAAAASAISPMLAQYCQ